MPATDGAPFWRRHELALTLAVVSGLVVLRGLVFAIYEHAYFDSDQAIVGLMAKHLSEGRAWPLFFYGQNYMLGVEAWWMVPFFWVGGATVTALRASTIATNLIIAALLVIGLVRWGGLRPVFAGIAALVFVFPPTLLSALLVEAQGGNPEPFLWVILLWFVRRKPLVFGAILAVGFLNREFTIYAAPVMVAGDLVQRRLFTAARLRHWLLVAAAFLLVFEGVQSAFSYSDWMGPGTRGMTLSDSQVDNLANRMRLQEGNQFERAGQFVRDVYVPMLTGRHIITAADQERRPELVWPVAVVLALLAARLGWLSLRTHRPLAAVRAHPFIGYILGLGIVSAVAVLALRPLENMPYRYLLLAAFIPIGLAAGIFALEPRRWLRAATAAVFIAYAAMSAADHIRLFSRFASGVPNPYRNIADGLMRRGVTVLEAPYWRAYKITFLTGERVKIGSIDFVRVQEYVRLAEREGEALRRLSEQPCEGGEAIEENWYLCPH